MSTTPTPLPEQQAFIERELSNHALLAAGPGTGKTWVLERRAEHLVEGGANPQRICLLTLTNAMVASLAERVPYGKASTVHSFALAHLNRLGSAWGRRVVAPWEQRELVRRDLKLQYEISFGHRCRLTDVDGFLKKLGSAFRDNQDDPADLSAIEQRLRQVFQGHRQLFGYALLDELVYDLVRLLESGAGLVNSPSHVLVDEYQDLTAGELRLLQLLAEHEGVAINACGDDRQAIYGFRKADPLGLHRFAQVYGLGDIDYLYRSRRLPTAICNLANCLADLLPALPGIERPALEPWAGREDAGVVDFVQAKSLKAECDWVIGRILELFAEGYEAKDMMVIASNFHDPVLQSLQKYAEKVSFSFVDPRRGPEQKSTELVLVEAVRRLASDADDQMAWRLLVYCCSDLAEGRLKKILQSTEAKFSARIKSAAGSDSTIKRVVQSHELIRAFVDQDDSPTDDGFVALVVEVAARLQGTVDLEIIRQASGFVEESHGEAVPGEEEEQLMPTTPGEVEVHTVHSSKGLERKVVFLVNAIEESFAGRPDPADGIRQLFVATTRASEQLYVTAPRFIAGTRLGAPVGANVVLMAEILTDACTKLGLPLRSV